MAKMEYHVFKKPKTKKDGKIFHRWYYYFYNSEGKKIQKACPGCRNRSDAEKISFKGAARRFNVQIILGFLLLF
jgi:hypothetical protein